MMFCNLNATSILRTDSDNGNFVWRVVILIVGVRGCAYVRMNECVLWQRGMGRGGGGY